MAVQTTKGDITTEAELIGVYDVMPQMVWVANFLCAQGLNLQHVILMQHNMSSILLEKNGCASKFKTDKAYCNPVLLYQGMSGFQQGGN